MVYFIAEMERTRTDVIVKPDPEIFPNYKPFTRREWRSNGIFKIGYTQHLSSANRIASCQTGNPRKLLIYRELEGDQEDEVRLHALLRRQRLEGEWFKIPPRMVYALRRTRTKSVDDLIHSLGGEYLRAWSNYEMADDCIEHERAYEPPPIIYSDDLPKMRDPRA